VYSISHWCTRIQESLIFSLHSTNHNHSIPNPRLTLSLFEPLKTVRLLSSTSDHQNSHLVIYFRQLLHSAMKFKTNAPVTNVKSTIEQQKFDSFAPKLIEPLTTVPPMKPKKKVVSKSTSKKKKAVKRGESKVALSMSDMYEKENTFVVTKEGTPAQASTKIPSKQRKMLQFPYGKKVSLTQP